MSDQLRLLAALHQAEALAVEGVAVRYALERASTAHAVDRGAVAAAWIEKRIECDRARAAEQAICEADAEPGDTSSPSPYAHTAAHAKRKRSSA